MNEKSFSVLEQYDLEVLSTYRFKGNYGCDTTTGRYILQQYENSNEKMEAMHVLYEHLKEHGISTDAVLERKEGGFVSISEDGYPYILKRWYEGQDCNINKKEHFFIIFSIVAISINNIKIFF